MKTALLIITLLGSLNVLAGSVDALTSIISIGDHRGINSNGDCLISVRVVNFPTNAINVTASDRTGEFTKLINDNSEYQHCQRTANGHANCSPDLKFFMQADQVSVDNSSDSYVEKSIRTSLSGTYPGKIYVVISERTVINTLDNEAQVACEINQ